MSILKTICFNVLWALVAQNVAKCSVILKGVDNDWEIYKRNHSLSFSDEEDKMRKEIFEKNMHRINKVNSEKRGYTLEMNSFGHLKPEELQNLHIHPATEPEIIVPKIVISKPSLQATVKSIPQHVDWRDKGVVTKIKDQGICGSCYAHGTIATIESRNAIHTGKLLKFSEQDIIDCSRSYGNRGCYGGASEYTLKYIMENGIATHESYPNRPYHLYGHACAHNKSKVMKLEYKSYRALYNLTVEEVYAEIAARGPVTAYLRTDMFEDLFYRFGIYRCHFTYHHEKPREISHTVSIIGYSNGTEPYFIIKNSWSKLWGKSGFLFLATDKKHNCRITDYIFFPVY